MYDDFSMVGMLVFVSVKWSYEIVDDQECNDKVSWDDEVPLLEAGLFEVTGGERWVCQIKNGNCVSDNFQVLKRVSVLGVKNLQKNLRLIGL